MVDLVEIGARKTLAHAADTRSSAGAQDVRIVVRLARGLIIDRAERFGIAFTAVARTAVVAQANAAPQIAMVVALFGRLLVAVVVRLVAFAGGQYLYID